MSPKKESNTTEAAYQSVIKHLSDFETDTHVSPNINNEMAELLF